MTTNAEAAPLFSRIRSFFCFLRQINLLDTLSDLEKCDVLLFAHDADRGVNLQGKAYSPLLDSVRDDLEKKGLVCTSIAHPWSVLVGSKAWKSPLAMNRSCFLGLLKRKLGKLFGIYAKKSDSFGPVFFNVYEKIIRRSKPRCIITIGAPIELCRAANIFGVFHVELLHGIGYAFIPWGFDKRKTEELPRGVLSLDDVSTQTFSNLNSLGVVTKQIPHPFIKRFVVEERRDSLPDEWKQDHLAHLGRYEKQILVSLTWGYAGDHGESIEYKDILSNGLFPHALASIIQETKKRVFWRFRFHPVQLRSKKYIPLFDFIEKFCTENPNTEWKRSSTSPLPAVLVHCSGNISMVSMAAYDAAYMGVPSLMMCPTIQPGALQEDYFADLEETGYVTKAPMTEPAIRQWLEKADKMEPMAAGLEDEAAWERAVDWMLGNPGSSNCDRPT